MFQSRTHTCNELRMEHVGQKVTIVGWMENVREVGNNFAFVVVRDFYGTTQVVVENETMMSIVKGINKESTISVEGVVRERASKNPKLPTGDIEIVPENYAIFYVDSMDRPQKYDGKTVEFTGQVLKPGKLAAGSFVLGRQVMTCCAADTQYMGLLCRYKGADSIRNEAWIRVKAEIRCENAPEYGAEGPVLYIRSAVLTGPIEEIATFS